MISITLQRIASLLSFRAYTPEIDDHRHPIALRMRGSRVALLNIGPGGAKVGSGILRKDGTFEISDVETHPFTQINDDLIAKLQALTDCNSLLISVGSPRSMVTLQALPKIKESDFCNRLYRDPKALIPNYEPDRVYQVLQHPTLEQSIIFSLPKEDILSLEKAFANTSLRILRIQLGIYNLARWMLSIPSLCDQEGFMEVLRIPVVMDQTQAFTMNTFGGWGPKNLMSTRSVLKSVTAKNEDSFEAADRVVDYFRTLAETARSHLGRKDDFPVDFLILDSKTPEAVSTIQDYMAFDPNLHIQIHGVEQVPFAGQKIQEAFHWWPLQHPDLQALLNQ